MAGKSISGKNDANNAQAICEAVRRPHMRFVTVKDENQQAMQCLHRTRQGFIEEKPATYKPIERFDIGIQCHRPTKYRCPSSYVF